MTAADYAKWSVATLVAAAILINITANSAASAGGPKRDAAAIIGVVFGVLIRIWILVAVIIWWQP